MEMQDYIAAKIHALHDKTTEIINEHLETLRKEPDRAIQEHFLSILTDKQVALQWLERYETAMQEKKTAEDKFAALKDYFYIKRLITATQAQDVLTDLNENNMLPFEAMFILGELEGRLRELEWFTHSARQVQNVFHSTKCSTGTKKRHTSARKNEPDNLEKALQFALELQKRKDKPTRTAIVDDTWKAIKEERLPWVRKKILERAIMDKLPR